MKRHLILAVAAVLLWPVHPARAMEERLPAEWYTLPEDAACRLERTEEADRLGKKAIERMFGEILEADGEALRLLDRTEAARGKFRLGGLQAELGISFKGVIAPVSLKGTATIAAIWQKRGARPPADDRVAGDLILTPSSTRAELREQLEPIIRTAIKTQKVKGEDVFRENVYESADEFFDLTRVIAASPPSSWWVSRFRLDLWVDLEGKVHPGVNAGAEFKLRFEFHRLMEARAVALDNPSPVQQKFKEFIGELSHDARAISSDTFQGTGFHLNTLRFGLGFTLKGNVGIVKWGGGIQGYLYLSSPAPGRAPEALAEEADASVKPLLLIEDGVKESHVRYAEANGIPYEIESRGPFKKIIYQLDRAKFRRGLGRAANLSSWFAKRASREQAGRWGVYELRPYFELSIGADFKLVSIAGIAGLEMSLINGDF